MTLPDAPPERHPTLTPANLNTLWHFVDLTEEKGHPPTLGEWAHACDIAVSTLRHHIEALKRAGRIRHAPGVARGIEIVTEEEVAR